MSRAELSFKQEITSLKAEIASLRAEYRAEINSLREEIRSLKVEKGDASAPNELQLSIPQQTQLAKQIMQMSIQPMTKAVAREIIPVVKTYVDAKHDIIQSEMRYHHVDGDGLVDAFRREVVRTSEGTRPAITDGKQSGKHLREGVSLVAADDDDWD